MERKRDLFYTVFGAVSLFLLLGVAVLHLLLPDRVLSESEKRKLAVFPDANIQSLVDGSFMNKAETYVSDQFPDRNRLMRLRMNLLRLSGKRESNGVFYGTGGQLIEAFPEYDEELREKTVSAVNAFCENHSFEHALFLLMPTAVGVYPEKMPAYAETGDQNAYIRAFTEALSDRITVLDPEPAVRRLKEVGKSVFYRTDHHWRTETAYEVFLDSCDEAEWEKGSFSPGTVCRTFSGSLASKSGFTPDVFDSITVYDNLNGTDSVLVLHPESRSEPTAGFYRESALKGSNPYEVFLGGNEPELVISTTADTNRTLLVLKDSYANCFLPFLADSYKTITVVDPRYSTQSIEMILMGSPSTDVLFLYNASTLAEDENLRILLNPDD